MGKFIKSIVAGVLALSMATWGAPVWAAIDDSASIGAGATIGESVSLSVQVLEFDTGAVASSISFATSGITDAEDAWRVANEYIAIDYFSNHAWGIRIVSNNIDLTASTDPSTDPISNYVAATMLDLDGDGSYTDTAYSGLLYSSDLDSGTSDEDPSMRAPLAWQVYADPSDVGDGDSILESTDITRSTSSLVVSGSGYYILDDNVGEWNSDWAYLVDKSDSGFPATDEVLEDGDGDGYEDDFVYYLVAGGFPGSDGNMAQHPASGGGSTPRPADGSIIVVLEARFANTNWGDTTSPVPYLLPSGDYNSSMYVELIHEE